jgi:hypothetical protein
MIRKTNLLGGAALAALALAGAPLASGCSWGRPETLASMSGGPGTMTLFLGEREVRIGFAGEGVRVRCSGGVLTVRGGGHSFRLHDDTVRLDGKSAPIPPCRQLHVVFGSDRAGVRADGKEFLEGSATASPEADRSESFAATEVRRVSIEGLSERLVVRAVAAGASEVRVARRGYEADLASVEAALSGGELRVRGKGYGFQPAVTVTVPAGTALRVADCRGAEIGDIAGALELAADAVEDVSVGRVASLKLDASGVGRVKVAAVDGGDAEVDSKGVGNVSIEGGRIAKLAIDSSGLAKVVCRAQAEEASITSTGSGDVKLVKPAKMAGLSCSGLGKVEFIKE